MNVPIMVPIKGGFSQQIEKTDSSQKCSHNDNKEFRNNPVKCILLL